ncbi:AIM24 family protein [Lusitaniella coriacea LEGE 07157]|uniref:AIM24 family protein n=1 Tax=Lusitaniella coriacea LEGE 07157 TaxID=945747 RepID=A0A8J7B7R5_9CYAN|nr:AIM24 family protein [Lusitaniella coriacea]MBE9114580.1 AIM24 family protein [Lusitaniella coriacea LEGE 07157]
MVAYTLINEKMLAVGLTRERVYAKKGSMISYQGDLRFQRSFLAGGGIQNLAMRQATKEELLVMSAQGTGQAYYAYNGLYVTVITLEGETMYVESDSLLAFDDRLRIGTVFLGNQGAIQGMIKGVVTDQGLFTTRLEGQGELAIVSHGNAIALEVEPQKPIFVDPNAYIGHKGQLQSQLVTDINWKTLIGKTSGESYQLKFVGAGAVYIQAYERETQP